MNSIFPRMTQMNANKGTEGFLFSCRASVLQTPSSDDPGAASARQAPRNSPLVFWLKTIRACSRDSRALLGTVVLLLLFAPRLRAADEMFDFETLRYRAK